MQVYLEKNQFNSGIQQGGWLFQKLGNRTYLSGVHKSMSNTPPSRETYFVITSFKNFKVPFTNGVAPAVRF